MGTCTSSTKGGQRLKYTTLIGNYFNAQQIEDEWQLRRNITNSGQSIKGIIWPESLRKLRFGYKFNQPVEEVKWPDTLQKLDLGSKFNHPIEETKWPNSC